MNKFGIVRRNLFRRTHEGGRNVKVTVSTRTLRFIIINFITAKQLLFNFFFMRYFGGELERFFGRIEAIRARYLFYVENKTVLNFQMFKQTC